jgi:hypothetical protein
MRGCVKICASVSVKICASVSVKICASVSCIHTMRISPLSALVDQMLSTSFIGMKGPVMKDQT